MSRLVKQQARGRTSVSDADARHLRTFYPLAQYAMSAHSDLPGQAKGGRHGTRRTRYRNATWPPQGFVEVGTHLTLRRTAFDELLAFG
eukprot:1089274-Rhodomonas_salina.2